MGKNIVMCSDGTGNTWAEQVSNVTRLVKSLALGRGDGQLAFYDQGIGTNPALVNVVKSFASEPTREGLRVLQAPKVYRWMPGVSRVAGLAVGFGLRENVKEMYRALAEHYDEGDRIYFFGFSRGAFTVRVLAGLLYRCGLLPKESLDGQFDRLFSTAYALYEPHRGDGAAVARFRATHAVVDCEVNFLGIWDTVKSYGGIWPKSLPHLRHNPIVRTVRHALAIDERRSWFQPTSWGGIDSDDKAAPDLTDPRYATQDVREVWFCGSHSDVGGGDEEAETARVPLWWMMEEARASGVRLNEEGARELASSGLDGPPETHESLRRWWWLSEYCPRWELDNRTRPPRRPFAWGRTGNRKLAAFRRQGKVVLHASVGVAVEGRGCAIE